MLAKSKQNWNHEGSRALLETKTPAWSRAFQVWGQTRISNRLPEVSKDHVSHVSYIKVCVFAYSYFINNVTPSPTGSHQEARTQDFKMHLKYEQNFRKLENLSLSHESKLFPVRVSQSSEEKLMDTDFGKAPRARVRLPRTQRAAKTFENSSHFKRGKQRTGPQSWGQR